jgi:electron transfer flavoprotein beta subunit
MICLRLIVERQALEHFVMLLILADFDFNKIAVYSMLCKAVAFAYWLEKGAFTMRIAVCLKQVPDTETKIKLKPDNSGIDTTGIKWIISSYDEYAIEAALQLKTAHANSTTTVYTAGPKSRAPEALRTALAMGIDEAVVIDAPDDADNFLVATALAAAIQKDGCADLILTGKLALDDNSSAVSQMLAEFLKIPHVTVVSKLTTTEASATAERETEGGTKEIFELSLPAVIGATKGLNTPRYASLPGIMKAKKKVIKEYDFAGLGVTAQNKIKYSAYKLPADKPPVNMIAGDASEQAKSLASLLRNEAKVL